MFMMRHRENSMSASTSTSALNPEFWGRRPSMPRQEQHFVMVKNLCVCVCKIDTHTEREREIGTKKRYIPVATNYKMTTTFTKGYKVTIYSDSLRATALYAIYTNGPNLGYPKEQCEYVHYTLVFDTEDLWFVDSGASNHMTSHQEWFHELREPERPGDVETGDDIRIRFNTSPMFHSAKKVSKQNQ